MLLALVIWPSTTHSFRNEAPFLLLLETPPTFGRSLRRFHIFHIFLMPILSPSCFAGRGHHLPIAIIFSLLSSVSISYMSPSSISLISSNTCRSSLYIPHSPNVRVLLSIALPHGHTCARTASSRLLVRLFLLSRRYRSPTRNRSSSVFAKSTGPCKYVFILIPSLNPPYISKCFFHLALFLIANISLLSIISSTSVLYLPNYSADITSSWFLLYPSMIFQLRYPTLFQLGVWLFSTIKLYQLWLATSFLACSLLYFAISTFSLLYFLNGYISSSALNTVLLVAREHLVFFLAAVIRTVSNCYTNFAFPSRDSPAYFSFGTVTIIWIHLSILLIVSRCESVRIASILPTCASLFPTALLCVYPENTMLRSLREGTHTGLRSVISPFPTEILPGSPYLRYIQLLHTFLRSPSPYISLCILASSLIVSAILVCS